VKVLGELLHLIGRYGYLTVFSGVMLESAGVPLPGETVLIAAGALVLALLLRWTYRRATRGGRPGGGPRDSENRLS
jgi:membrane protein DedA with SNARE-associated domain